MSETTRYETVHELAARLQTSAGALYMQRHRGDAPGALAVRVGRKLLWSSQAVDAWFAEQTEANAQRAAQLAALRP